MKSHRQNPPPPPNFKPIRRSIREPASLALAGVLREWRLRWGWTLGKLAEVSGIKRHGISLIETNQRNARIETAERIGRALGVLGSQLLWLAERRAARWPTQCQKCNYCLDYALDISNGFM
jgi:transcriptional regulator with XRE-family HTH domain